MNSSSDNNLFRQSELDYGTDRLDYILDDYNIDGKEIGRVVESLRVSHELAYNELKRRSGHPYIKHPFSILEQYLGDGFTTYLPVAIGHDVPEESIRRVKKHATGLAKLGEDLGLEHIEENSALIACLESVAGHDQHVESIIQRMRDAQCFLEEELDIIKAFTPTPGNSKMQNYQKLANHAMHRRNVATLVIKAYDMFENVSDIEYIGDSSVCSFGNRAKKIRSFLKGIPKSDIERQSELLGYRRSGDFREVLYQRLDHIINTSSEEAKRRELF